MAQRGRPPSCGLLEDGSLPAPPDLQEVGIVPGELRRSAGRTGFVLVLIFHTFNFWAWLI